MDRTFSLSEVYNSLVYLEPTTRDDDVPRRRVDVVVDVKQNDVRREGDVVDVEREREKRVYGTSGASQGGVPDGLDRSGEDIPISPKKPEDTSTSQKRATGGGSGGVNHYVGGTSGVRRDASGTSTSDKEEDRQTIAEELEEDRRRQAEEAERVRTPSPKDEGGGRGPTAEEAEALEVARSLQAAGKRVTFGNVEAYLEKRSGGYVEPKVVKRLLSVLGGMGWTTAKDGALSEGVVL
jgi:hypothetical protein